MTTETRKKAIAATLDQVPAGVPIIANNGKGAIAPGVKGFISTVGVGSDDSHSYTIRLEPSMSNEIKTLTTEAGTAKAAVVRNLLKMGLRLKQLGLSLEDLEVLKK